MSISAHYQCFNFVSVIFCSDFVIRETKLSQITLFHSWLAYLSLYFPAAVSCSPSIHPSIHQPPSNPSPSHPGSYCQHSLDCLSIHSHTFSSPLPTALSPLCVLHCSCASRRVTGTLQGCRGKISTRRGSKHFCREYPVI